MSNPFGWTPSGHDRMRCSYPDCPSQYSKSSGEAAAGPHLHKGLVQLSVTELRTEKRTNDSDQGAVSLTLAGLTKKTKPFPLTGTVDKEPQFFLVEAPKGSARLELHLLTDDGEEEPLGEVSVNLKDYSQQKTNGRWYPLKKHSSGTKDSFNSKRTIKVAVFWTPPGQEVYDWALGVSPDQGNTAGPGVRFAGPVKDEPSKLRKPRKDPEVILKDDSEFCCDYILVVANPHKLKGMGEKKKTIFGKEKHDDGIPTENSGGEEDHEDHDPDEGTPLTAEDDKIREKEEIMHQAIKHVALIQRNLKSAGIDYKAYLSLDSRSIILELSASEEALIKFAKHISFPLMMKDEWAGGPVEMSRYFRMKEDIESDDYSEIAANSDTLEVSVKKKMHASIFDDRYKIFNSALRVRLLHEAITMPNTKGGAGINIIKLSHSDKEALRPVIIKDMFPSHQRANLYSLDSSWVFSIFRLQPLDKLKNYYGTEVALYFAFAGYYATWLACVGVVGVPISIYQLATRQADNMALSTMTIIICIVLSIYLGMWKRKEHSLAFRWGTHASTRDEIIRKEFQPDGEVKIAGKSIPTYSNWKLQLRVIAGWPVLMAFNLLGLCVTALLLIMHQLLLRYNAIAAGVVVGFGVATVVVIFNQLFNYIAFAMTRMENHRTEREFRNSYTIKTFVFYFVISYTPLIYIAFVKPFIKDACHPAYDGGPPDCMNELAVVLWWVFIFRLLIRFAMHIVFPLLFLRVQVWRLHMAVAMKPGRKSFAFAEAQRLRSNHTGVVDNYMEIVVQFGYLAFFGVAFPALFLVAAVIQAVDIKWQAYRLVHMIKRPFPHTSSSIGIYYTLMEVVAFAGIVSNCLIFAVTSTMLSSMDFKNRLWVFLVTEHTLLLTKVAIGYYFNRYTWSTTKKMRDQQYHHDRVVYPIYSQILDAPGGFSRKVVYEDSDEDAPLKSPDQSVSGSGGTMSSIGPSPSELAYKAQQSGR